MNKSHSLIIRSEPIMFVPELACLVGVSCAIVIQKLQFLLTLRDSGKIVDGEKWIFNTYEQWREKYFPFYSTDTIKRAFNELEEIGFVKSFQPDGRASRRKYYRITEAGYSLLDMKTIPEEGILPPSDADQGILPSSERGILPSSLSTESTTESTNVSLSSNESKDTRACSRKSLTCSPEDLDLPDDSELSFDDTPGEQIHPSKAIPAKDLFTGVVIEGRSGNIGKKKAKRGVARPPLPGAPTPDEFIEAWNGSIILPQIAAFSAGRQKEFRARCREKFFCENWRVALKNLCRSKFHLGDNSRNWRVTVDWFLKPDSVPKLIEQAAPKPEEEQTFLSRSYRDDDKPFYDK